MGHQKAAFEVLTNLFTPQTAMQTPVGRAAVMWYARFDVFISIMGSIRPSLPQEWYSAPVEHFEGQVAAEPNNVGWKLEACAARLRMISMEMPLLYAKGAKQEVTEEEYTAEHRRLAAAWDDWKNSWDPALTDAAYAVTEFPGNQTPHPDDIVNPFTPGVLFRPPLFAATLMTCEYHTVALMHASQSALKLTDEDRAKAMERAYAICEIAGAVESWPHSPPGSLIVLQSCLAIATLFMPRDPKHYMWLRRKFALGETIG
jgi:hypothetical protein